MIVRRASQQTSRHATPPRVTDAPAGLPSLPNRQAHPYPNTPTGFPTADSDGGCEGQDARRIGSTHGRPSVNADRISGVRTIAANLANVAGGGCSRLPQEFHDAAGRHRAIASEAGDELLNDLTDHPRAVIIGLKLAAHPGFGTIDIPMIFIPVIHAPEMHRA